jgi:hypothetical protein
MAAVGDKHAGFALIPQSSFFLAPAPSRQTAGAAVAARQRGGGRPPSLGVQAGPKIFFAGGLEKKFRCVIIRKEYLCPCSFQGSCRRQPRVRRGRVRDVARNGGWRQAAKSSTAWFDAVFDLDVGGDGAANLEPSFFLSSGRTRPADAQGVPAGPAARRAGSAQLRPPGCGPWRWAVFGQHGAVFDRHEREAPRVQGVPLGIWCFFRNCGVAACATQGGIR